MTRARLRLPPTLLTLVALATASACAIEPEPGVTDEGDGISLPDDAGDETGGELPDIPDLPGDDQRPPSCETTTTLTATTPANVMLVLDKSRSMVNYTWDDDGAAQTAEVTRWASLHATVEQITGDYEAAMNLGLTLFPGVESTGTIDDACLVSPAPDVEVGPDRAAAILAAIPSADSLELYGATPAAAGLATALAHLEALGDDRRAAMILVTDGAANCGLGADGLDRFNAYDEDLPLLVADAWERAGVPTYVVGIDIEEVSEHPFTNPRAKLDELAQLGGVPRPGELGFYDARDADGLTAALDEIAASVSCTVELGEAPSGPDQLVVSLAGELVPQLDSCAEGDGWIYTEPDASLDRIELCNAACDALLDIGELEAEFSCPLQP